MDATWRGLGALPPNFASSDSGRGDNRRFFPWIRRHLPYGQHRARGHADDALRDAAHEGVRQTSASVCSHHDQIELFCDGVIADAVRRPSRQDCCHDRSGEMHTLVESGRLQVSEFPARSRDQIRE